MRYFFLLLIINVFLYGKTLAQEQPNKPLNGQTQSKESTYIWQRLDVESSPVLMDLLQKQYDQSKRNSTFSGYRVQVFFGSGSDAHAQAVKIKSDISLSNPDYKTYLIFKSPDFIVRVGDFRTKSEALKVQKTLLAKYPSSFILADEIKFPDLVSSNIFSY